MEFRKRKDLVLPSFRLILYEYTIYISRLAVQKGDILGSGVPYWPIELVTLATSVLMAGDQVKVLDLFSEGTNIFEESYDIIFKEVLLKVL